MGVNSLCLVERHQNPVWGEGELGFERRSLEVAESVGVGQKKRLGRRKTALAQAKGCRDEGISEVDSRGFAGG